MKDLDAVNIYYKPYMSEIGGVETMTYNLAIKYAKKKDILFLFGSGDVKQLSRLRKIADVKIYDEKKIYRCKRCHIAFDTPIPKNIIADDYVRMGHANFVDLVNTGHWNMPEDADQTINYGVSKNTCRSIEQLTGKPCGYCPNPYIHEIPKPLLKLISPQRISWEKGSERIKEMARQLDQHNIPFQWIIASMKKEDIDQLNNPSIIWLKSRLDIKTYIADADYLVLLSDTEGSPMAPQEALMLGVPIVVTKLPWVDDLNIDENYGFFLKKDMSDLDVEEIYRKKGKFKFKFEPPEDLWGELLLDGKTEKIKERKLMDFYKVKATAEAKERGIEIPEAGGIPELGQEFEITEDRIEALTGKNTWGAIFVYVEGKVEQNKAEEPSGDPKSKKKTTKKKE